MPPGRAAAPSPASSAPRLRARPAAPSPPASDASRPTSLHPELPFPARALPQGSGMLHFTPDSDTAFARHGLLASACAMATWFCDAYASWQKGAVENANGRLRRDLPRDLDLDALSDAELQEIVLSHNLTPRKCLGFLTPLQALLGELGRDVQIRFA